MKVSSFIKELRIQLSDVDCEVFSDAILVEYMNDGLCEVMGLRPEMFTKSRVVKGCTGEVQCLPECCTKLVSVDGVVDKRGNPVSNVRQVDTQMQKDFDKEGLPQTQNVSYSFNVRPNVLGQFEVIPAVKASECVFFRITCVTKPDALKIGSDTNDCGYHNALTDYVLYRAYSLETESPTSIALKQQYYAAFLGNVERKQNSDLRLTDYDATK